MSKQRIEFTLGFKADTAQAKKELESLASSLKQLATMPATAIGDAGFKEASKAALELQQSLENAVNVDTGKLDLTKFASNLQKNGKKLKDYKIQLETLGPAGTKAFNQVTRSIANAEVPTVKLNAHLSNFLTTLKNTAKWQLTSNITHGLQSGLQSALTYAQSLDKSLTNIRIVTGASSEQMAQFAKQASEAAKSLKTTTVAYTDASLIYYQQGLKGKEVTDRADITTKMAAITGQTTETISDQLTSVWNNFYDGSKSLEYYADVLTRLGADTASSSDEIVQGLQKFSSVADTIGLSYEYAAASLATITSTTRESADVVGTALKTLFSRIQGLKLGETLEDGVDLNKYSEALDKVGVKVLDQNNELREMDAILNDLGAKWNTLGKAQQTSLAQTVAGVRQYTQLITLMDNWDFMQQNVEKSKTADNSLQEQFDIWQEGWEASVNAIKAAKEGIGDSLIDKEIFIGINNAFADVLEGVETFVDVMGGLPGLIQSIASLLLIVFANKVPGALHNLGNNFKATFGIAKKETLALQNQAQILNSQSLGKNATLSAQLEQKQLNSLLTMKQRLLAIEKNLTAEERSNYEVLIQKTDLSYQQLIDEAKELEIQQRQTKELMNQLSLEAGRYAETNKIYVPQISDKDVSQAYNKFRQIYWSGSDTPKDQLHTYRDANSITSKIDNKIKSSQTDDERKKWEEAKQALQDYLNLYNKYKAERAPTFSFVQGKKDAQASLESINQQINGHERLKATIETLTLTQENWEKNGISSHEEVKKALQRYMDQHKDVVTTANGATKEQELAWEQLGIELGEEEIDLQKILNLLKEIQKFKVDVVDDDGNVISQTTGNMEEWQNDFVRKVDNQVTQDAEQYGYNVQKGREAIEGMRKDARRRALLDESYSGLIDPADEALERTQHISSAVSALTGHLMSLGMSITSITSTVDVFNNESSTWIDKLSAILTLIGTLGFSLMSINSITTQFAALFPKAAKKATVDAAALGGSMVGVQVGAKGAEKGVKGLTVALKGMSKANVILLAIELALMSIVAVYSVIQNKAQKDLEKAKEEAEKAREEAEALRKSRTDNTDLIQQMDAALKAYKENGEGKEELDRITEQLAETYNLEGAAIAKLTGQYDDYFRFLQKTNQAKRDELKLEQQKTQIAIDKQYGVIGKSNISNIGTTSGGKIKFAGQSVGDDKSKDYLDYFFMTTSTNASNVKMDTGKDLTFGEGNKIVFDLLSKYGFDYDSGTNYKYGLYNVEDTVENRIKLYNMLLELNEAVGGYDEYEAIIKSFEDSGIKELIADQEYLRSVQLFTGDIPEIQELVKQEGKNSIDAWTEDLGSVDEYKDFVDQLRKTLENSGKYTKEEIDKAINNIIDYSSNSDLRDFKAISDLLEDRASRLPKAYGDTLKQSLSKEDLKEWYNKLTDEQKDLVPSLNFDIVYNEEQLNQQLHLAQLQLDNTKLTTQIEAGINAIDALSKDDWAAFSADNNLWGENGLMIQAGYKFTDFYNQHKDNPIEALGNILIGNKDSQGLFKTRNKNLENTISQLENYKKELNSTYLILAGLGTDTKLTSGFIADVQKITKAIEISMSEGTEKSQKNVDFLMQQFSQRYGLTLEQVNALMRDFNLNSVDSIEGINALVSSVANEIKKVDNEIESAETEIIVNAEMEPGYIDKITKAIEGIKVEPLEVPITPVIEGRFLQSDAVISGLESYINSLKTELESPTITSDRKTIIEGLIEAAEGRLQTERNNQVGEAEKYRDFDINAADKFFSTFSFERITSATDENGNQIIGSVFGDGNGNIWISDGKGGSKKVSLTERDAVAGTYNYAQIVSDSLEAEKTSRINIYNEKFAGKTETEEAKTWYNKYIQPIQNLIDDVLLYTGNVSASTQNVYNKQAAASNKPDEKTWEPPSDFSYTIRDRFASYDEAVEKSLDEFNKALDELAYASIGQKFENVINAYDTSIDQKTNRLLGPDGLESKIAGFLAGRNINDFSFASNPNWKDEVARELEAKRTEIEAMEDGEAKDKALYDWEQTEKHYNEAIDLEKELGDLTKAREDFIKDSRKRLEEELKAAEDLVDVYAALNRELEKIDRTIQRIEKDRENAFGQSYLDTFDEELKALEKEDKTLTSINDKIETKRPKRQSDIQKSIDAASDGFKELGAVYDPETGTWDLNTKFELKFDEEGFLENEEKLRESANALVELYRSIAEAAQKAADEAKLAAETTVDDPTTEINEQAEAKAAWDAAEAKVATANTNLDAVSNYVNDIFEKVDKANNEAKTYVDNAEKMADNARRWLEINFERWNYTLELGLEVNDRDLEMLEYKLGKIEDDIYSVGEAWTLTNQQVASHFTGFDVINQSYENLTNLFNAGQIAPAKYAEGLKSIYSEAMEGAKSLDEIDEKMRTFYSDTLDLAIEQIDKYASALEHQTSVLEHYYNLITLINGEADYEKIGMILEGQAKTLENEMKFSTEQYQNAVNAQTEYQAFFDTLSDEDKKKYQANLDAINEQVREAEEEMLSDTEAWAEKLKEILENKMAEASDILEKTFSGGMGFDSLNNSIDRLNDYQDIYLTKTNQVYEIQKLMRTAQQAADKTDNAAAKQRINNFVQETKKLQEKNKLSHLELEIQQAQYDMLMAQIALEEAKNAKTTVRLRRDSQGNFGYVYTADQEQVAKAEQELADAENRLYNISLEATNEWGQKRLELQQQYADAMIELEERRANGEFATDEMYQQERDRITQEFYRNMEAYSGQYTIALNGHANTQADAWIRAYEDMMAESDKWNEATTQYLDANEKAYGEWKDEVAKNSAIVDGVLKNTQTEVQKVTDKSEELRKKGNEVAISMWTQVSAAQGAQKEYINLSRTVDDLRLDYLNMAAAAQSALDQISKINSLQMVNPYYTTYKNTNEDLSSLMTQHIVNGGQIGDMKWEALTQIRDEKIQANGNVSAFMTNAQIQQILSDYTNLKDSNPDALSVQWVNAILGGQAHYTPENYQKFMEELEKRNWIPGIKLFDTGGYTGEWGPQGRLAVVHEKELVLKQDDTANFLLATGMLRNIASMIDLNAANSLLATGLQNPFTAAAYAPGTLDQNVTIEAHFPNATDRDEITEAFNTLINTASQYANRKTK